MIVHSGSVSEINASTGNQSMSHSRYIVHFQVSIIQILSISLYLDKIEVILVCFL